MGSTVARGIQCAIDLYPRHAIELDQCSGRYGQGPACAHIHIIQQVHLRTPGAVYIHPPARNINRLVQYVPGTDTETGAVGYGDNRLRQIAGKGRRCEGNAVGRIAIQTGTIILVVADGGVGDGIRAGR